MVRYEIGQIIPEFIGHEECVKFDVADDGASLLVFFNRPNTNEIEQFKNGHSFEIRYVQLKEVIMILVKIGSLNWMDAPYTPHLSKNLTRLVQPEPGQGLALTIYLIDSATGKICSMRLVGLSERFTKSLFDTVSEVWKKDWNPNEYRMTLNRIFASYTTKDLVKNSTVYCKIN